MSFNSTINPDKQSMLLSNDTKPSSKGLSGGLVAVIVIVCLLFIVILCISSFLIYRRIQKRRKNHGEYQPKLEEELHGKDLPAISNISPPSIEGLI